VRRIDDVLAGLETVSRSGGLLLRGDRCHCALNSLLWYRRPAGPNSRDRGNRSLAAQQTNPPEKPGPANRRCCDRLAQIALVRNGIFTFQ
jgi:hypothetical protein